MYVWVGCSFSMVAKMSILNYLIRLSNSCKCMGVNGEALLEAHHYICPMHAAIPPFPGSPSLEHKYVYARWESLVSFLT